MHVLILPLLLLTEAMHSSFLNKQYFHFIAIYSRSLKHKDQTQHLIKLSFIKNDKIIGKNISAWVCKIEKQSSKRSKHNGFLETTLSFLFGISLGFLSWLGDKNLSIICKPEPISLTDQS